MYRTIKSKVLVLSVVISAAGVLALGFSHSALSGQGEHLGDSDVIVNLGPASITVEIKNTSLRDVIKILAREGRFAVVGDTLIGERRIYKSTVRGTPAKVFARLLRRYSYVVVYRPRAGADSNDPGIERLIVLGPSNQPTAGGPRFKESKVVLIPNNRSDSAALEAKGLSSNTLPTASSAGQPVLVKDLLASQLVVQQQDAKRVSGRVNRVAGSIRATSVDVSTAIILDLAAGRLDPSENPEAAQALAQLTRTVVQNTSALVKGLEIATRTHLDVQRK